jgi:GeoRSP system SPASM domain protein
MNLNNLQVPIIVYWDINPLSDMTSDVVHALCDDLIKNKIFVLSLWDPSPVLNKISSTILQKLKNEHMNVTLTVPPSALDDFDGRNFMPALKKILILYENIDQLSSGLEEIKSSQIEALPIGVSFFINETTYRSIPDVFKLCFEAGIKDIHFPIQRPKSGKEIFCPDDEITGWLSSEIKDIKTDDLHVNVHDPFLWGLFNKNTTENTKGCQGANTMVYITGDLTVTPCPLLPIELGSLKHSTLTEVFLSDKRQQVRKRLAAPPQECVDCERLKGCLGGCRGRAYILDETFNKKDPACHYS